MIIGPKAPFYGMGFIIVMKNTTMEANRKGL